MNCLQRLPIVLKTYISTFLSYDEKKASYRILECKRPERSCIPLDEIEHLYEVAISNLKGGFGIYIKLLYDNPPNYYLPLKSIAPDDWFIRLPQDIEEVVEHLSPSNIIRICMLKQYLNNLSGRHIHSSKVWLQCPHCRKYSSMDLILYGEQMIVDLHVIKSCVYRYWKTVCFCDCIIKPGITYLEEDGKGKPLKCGRGAVAEGRTGPVQDDRNFIVAQYEIHYEGCGSETKLGHLQNNWPEEGLYEDWDPIVKKVLTLNGYDNDKYYASEGEDPDERELRYLREEYGGEKQGKYTTDTEEEESDDDGEPILLSNGHYELP